jgi:hypothetical protein
MPFLCQNFLVGKTWYRQNIYTEQDPESDRTKVVRIHNTKWISTKITPTKKQLESCVPEQHIPVPYCLQDLDEMLNKFNIH